MSDTNRTPEEYVQRYAKTYCNGDISEALKHEIVREVFKEKMKNES